MFKNYELAVECPYCSHINKIKVTSRFGADVMFCDHEEGPGCDNQFVYKWYLSIKVDSLETSETTWGRRQYEEDKNEDENQSC